MGRICKTLFLLITLNVGVVYGDTPDARNKFFTFTFENDIFVGEDDGYTNGTGITFGSAGFDEFSTSNVPWWIHWLIKDRYINTAPNKTRAIAHMFFQRMQTPTVITDSDFIVDDVPYAGLLAWQGTAYSWDANVSDQMSLYLGMVGPVTQAEQAQKLIHSAIGSDEPLGWRFQLKNEPVFKIELQRTWKLYRNDSSRFQYDVVGLGGVGLGNLITATKGGFAVRFGTNLSNSMGGFSLQADRHVNSLAFTKTNDFYFFVGARAGYVAHDILINGNTFTDSHSVSLEHFQNEAAAGALWSRNRWAFVFAVLSASAQTELNDDRESFGAFSVTYRY